MNTGYETVVEPLLAAMKKAAIRQDMATFERKSDELAVYMRGALAPSIDVSWRKYGLTTKEARLASLLYQRMGTGCTRSALMDVLYFDMPDEDEPDAKILDIFICHIRKKLAGTGFKIDTIWGTGWAMKRCHKADGGASYVTYRGMGRNLPHAKSNSIAA